MDFVPMIQIRGANLKGRIAWETYHHKNSLPVDVVEAMRPVFRDLANPELLKKCLHGGTQNPNESVNNVIWSRVPKKTFVQLEVLSLGDGVSRQTEAVTSKILLFTKTKEVRKEKRLKRKKEDDELLKNADDLEYGAKMFKLKIQALVLLPKTALNILFSRMIRLLDNKFKRQFLGFNVNISSSVM
ncbi:uncharacterized protein TNCV_578301 [Trichonephila clavipes]|nr:uncharacterized protein TNCV_578301 [Trichonephila clavipes]